MTIDVKNTQTLIQGPKWELAQRLAGQANAPKDALESIFKGAINALEEESKTTISPSIKQRVWENVSKERLKTLTQAFLEEFCKETLGSFTEEEINQMLQEHKQTNVIKYSKLNIQLQVSFQLTQPLVIDVVVRKAQSMVTEWIPEIAAAVEKEGIKLPKPSKT